MAVGLDRHLRQGGCFTCCQHSTCLQHTGPRPAICIPTKHYGTGVSGSFSYTLVDGGRAWLSDLSCAARPAFSQGWDVLYSYPQWLMCLGHGTYPGAAISRTARDFCSFTLLVSGHCLQRLLAQGRATLPTCPTLPPFYLHTYLPSSDSIPCLCTAFPLRRTYRWTTCRVPHHLTCHYLHGSHPTTPPPPPACAFFCQFYTATATTYRTLYYTFRLRLLRTLPHTCIAHARAHRITHALTACLHFARTGTYHRMPTCLAYRHHHAAGLGRLRSGPAWLCIAFRSRTLRRHDVTLPGFCIRAYACRVHAHVLTWFG